MDNANTQVLLVAASSGDGQFRHLIDPELRRRLAAAGVDCYSCFINQLEPEHLDEVDTVVLMRFPMIGHCRNDYPDFKMKTPWFYEFVRNGGNLIMMFAESYGRSEAAMNEFTEDWKISFGFNRIDDSDPTHCHMMPYFDCGRLIRCDVSPEAMGLSDITELDLIVDGGHGTQQLTCFPNDPSWQPFIRGSATCQSTPFPQGFYGGGGAPVMSSPIFGAWRVYGKGRVIAFPGASPLWLANAFLPRWQGTLMNQYQGTGFRFIHGLLNRRHADLAGRAAPVKIGSLNIKAVSDQEFSFRYVTPAERRELAELRQYRVWIGTIPDGKTVDDVIRDAQSCGCAVAVVVYDWFSLSRERWQQLRHELAQFKDIIVVPGYEQLDEEGNNSVVFNVDELPEQRLRYPSSNLLEDLLVKINGYSAVCARPESNRMEFWRYGGYNLLEVGTDGEQQIFRECVAAAGFIGGVHINRGVMPSSETLQTWILARTPADWKHAVTENLHLSQVTAGPRLLRFDLPDVKLIIDDWEGYWYEWENGQTATIHLELESDSPLTDIRLWDGNTVLRHFTSDQYHVEQDFKLTLEADLHLHVTARDAAGKELLCSWPLHFRNRFYWAHCGSDQMNDYHNVFEPNPDGFLGIGDSYYEPYGFVTCGRAWGDYLRITPPVPWSDIMPTGIEVSSMVGNFKSFHPSPFVMLPSGMEYLNHHYRRLGRCTQDVHMVYSDADSAWLEIPGASWKNPEGRVFNPTRTAIRSRNWRCQAVYTIPRWQKYQPCPVKIDLTLEWLAAVELAPGQTISLGHSLHQWQDGLELENSSLALCELLHSGRPEAPAGEKEWDTLGILPLLQMPTAQQPTIILTPEQPLRLTGDPAVTYGVVAWQVPGVIQVRGWHWQNHTFVLSYELLPDRKKYSAGDKLQVKYEIFCAAGAINGGQSKGEAK